MPCETRGFTPAEPTETEAMRDNSLGIRGAWFVFQGRDYFTAYDDGTFAGYEISNCCGSFILAVPKATAPVNPDETPKQKEIRLITELMDLKGYFADEFCAGDLDKMISNIKSDFPVFMGTAPDILYQKEKTQRELSDGAYDTLKSEYNKCMVALESLERVNAELNAKLKFILESYISGAVESCPYAPEFMFFNQTEIITAKLQNNIPLDEDDNAYVLNLMNNSK